MDIDKVTHEKLDQVELQYKKMKFENRQLIINALCKFSIVGVSSIVLGIAISKIILK